MRRYGVVTCMCVALLCGCMPKGKQAPPQPRLFECRRARGTITIDGKLDEPAWKAAQYLDDFRLPGSFAKPESPSSARLLWDDQNLYLAMVMQDFDVYATHKEHDSRTWEDDVAELFLKPSDHAHHYYELQVNALNTKLDLLIPRRGAGNLDRFTPWQSGMASAVVVKGTLHEWRDKDKGWMVEAAIPLKAFLKDTPKPQIGDRWRFAVCRYDYSVYLERQELSSSARLPVSDFHHFEGYDSIEFAE